MAGFVVQYLNSRVYEVEIDDATKNTNSLIKQTNNTIPVIGYRMERRPDVCYDELVKEFEEMFKDSEEPLWKMRGYPLTDKFVGVSADMDHRITVDPDQKCNYTIIYGWTVEQRRHDPNKPIIVQGDTSPEAIAKARADALKPYTVTRPFLLVFPESDRMMFDITVTHAPQGAVTHWDSTKQEQAPTDGELEAIPSDPLSPLATMTAEDRLRLDQVNETLARMMQNKQDVHDLKLVVKELNQEWCQTPEEFQKFMQKFAITGANSNAREEAIVPKPITPDIQPKVDAIGEVWRELMDNSDNGTINGADLLAKLQEKGYDWFATTKELDVFLRTYVLRAPIPEDLTANQPDPKMVIPSKTTN